MAGKEIGLPYSRHPCPAVASYQLARRRRLHARGTPVFSGKRPDKWYQWHVEAARCVQIAGIPAVDAKRRRREYRIGFRTCPAHEIVHFVPGIGITRYVFSHHGTVAEADVRLIEFRRGVATHTGGS